eukprot:1181759-Prorocentrum_minimum.AAC.2
MVPLAEFVLSFGSSFIHSDFESGVESEARVRRLRDVTGVLPEVVQRAAGAVLHDGVCVGRQVECQQLKRAPLRDPLLIGRFRAHVHQALPSKQPIRKLGRKLNQIQPKLHVTEFNQSWPNSQRSRKEIATRRRTAHRVCITDDPRQRRAVIPGARLRVECLH